MPQLAQPQDQIPVCVFWCSAPTFFASKQESHIVTPVLFQCPWYVLIPFVSSYYQCDQSRVVCTYEVEIYFICLGKADLQQMGTPLSMFLPATLLSLPATCPFYLGISSVVSFTFYISLLFKWPSLPYCLPDFTCLMTEISNILYAERLYSFPFSLSLPPCPLELMSSRYPNGLQCQKKTKRRKSNGK